MNTLKKWRKIQNKPNPNITEPKMKPKVSLDSYIQSAIVAKLFDKLKSYFIKMTECFTKY